VRLLAQDRLEARAVAVVTGARSLADTQRAFDGVAATYDRSNEENAILRAMRTRARAALQDIVAPGARILDLGCGPGTDDVPLARCGYDVTAIDWSPAMVVEARQAIRRAAADDRVRVRHLGIHQLDDLAPMQFDAAFSNFGALNCVPDLGAAARAIAGRLRPGGVLVASVIGRVCPWEIAVYLARRDWRRAALRFTRGQVAVPLEGRTVWTQYYTPAEFCRAFARAGLSRVSLRTLGCAAPPPYLSAFAGRHPRLVARLHAIDDRIGAWPVLRACGDHFLIVLRRS
jgi:SAM-dependent methyltransferase